MSAWRVLWSLRVTAGCAVAFAWGLLLPAGASAVRAHQQTPSSVAAPAEQPGAVSSTSPQPDPTPPVTPVEVQLSNGLTLTIWAHPEARGPIRAQPATDAARIAKVRLYDPDGFRNVYLLLSSYVDPEGREWVRVRIPGRPNGRTGWMLRELLGGFHRTRWRIVVDRGARRMGVYYDGRLRRVFPVGVGKPSTPTPAGHFWIDERFKLSSPSSPYWPYALGTSDYSTLPNWPGEGVVGIHGPYGERRRSPATLRMAVSVCSIRTSRGWGRG